MKVLNNDRIGTKHVQPFTRTYGRGQVIREAAAQEFSWVRVETGAARRSLYYGSGRRQVLDFLLKGELHGTDSGSTTEALEDGTIVTFYTWNIMEDFGEPS